MQEQRALYDYLVSSTDAIRSKHRHCGVVILGDLNHLNIQDLVGSHHLKQVVASPTRRDAILDYIITNLQFFDGTPEIFAPLGSSDDNSIMRTPKDTFDNRSDTCVKHSVRRYPTLV